MEHNKIYLGDAYDLIKQIENHAKRINKLVYKLRKNGQYKLLSNSNVPMDQSQGRGEYVKAFIEKGEHDE